MELSDKITDIARNINKHKTLVATEEATKNAFVMPFISALGYNVFDPSEVVPEFTADVGTKKGEKVDYAIICNGELRILIECKSANSVLTKDHASQLFRYYGTTNVRFAILTNGIIYKFYTDSEEKNKMDDAPFFTFDLIGYQASDVAELKKFAKDDFSVDNIIATASTLKYAGAVKRVLAAELLEPSEAFVRFFIGQIYDGRVTQSVLDEFTQIVKSARAQFINEQANVRLKKAMSNVETIDDNENTETTNPDNPDIETTVEEIEGFHIVKAILREKVNC